VPSTASEIVERWERARAEIEKVPRPPNVSALLDEAADRYEGRVAWSFFELGESVTFRDAQLESLRAASVFRSHGIGRGDRVGMMVPNCPAFLVAFFGLARLGAVIVPVNGRYSSREVAHVLNQSDAKLLIFDSSHADVVGGLAEEGCRVEAIELRAWSDLVACAGQADHEVRVSETDLLSIQFTSGTTGFPKGCMLTHRYWINAAVSWGEYVDVPVEHFLCNQMLFYLDGQYNAMYCLYRGVTFFCASKPSSSKFLGWLREHRINSCFYFDPLFVAPRTPDDADNDLELLHICGFNPRRHAELEERYGCIARETYGMTEFAPALIMPLDAALMVGSGSCGLPAPFTDTRIVDERGHEVERGEIGELWVRSPAMMAGYCGDPDATAETLANGWLHTGDLFRQDEAGFFYIVGRIKDMIRRNAENVACVEVEGILRLIPGVKEAATVAVPDDVVGEEIKAYVQLMPGTAREDLPPSEILAFCATQLASFKVPRYLEYHDSFPMTESARVEKKKLTAGIEDLTVGAYDRVTGEWKRA
jgi:long-chain acyl-CoA synthetase